MKWLKGFSIIVLIGLIIFLYFRSKMVIKKYIYLDKTWEYADYSIINSGAAVLYSSKAFNKKEIVVAVNAGHGTIGGETKNTYCHPDKTPKVTGGTTKVGSIMAVAVSTGTTFIDGTREAEINLKVAQLLKNKLLSLGYDVLMIRDEDDIQLDNVARTVIANNIADIHISIHFDDSANDNGAFYISVPDNETYRMMEPVASHWEEHDELGKSLIDGLKEVGVKVSSNNFLPIDLTQTSFSTIPSVDIELGDKKSDISEMTLKKYVKGLLLGIDKYLKR